MTKNQMEQIKTQMDILAIHNQQVGCYELSIAILGASKSRSKKLFAAKTDAHNSAVVLKNMIQEFSNASN